MNETKTTKEMEKTITVTENELMGIIETLENARRKTERVGFAFEGERKIEKELEVQWFNNLVKKLSK